ncbi:MAG TPA: outer membrane lipoprotein carrier protein LolA [Chitinophagaceae bacterium]|nr:outer membrane lipoprotein carrier protein LolA [Chitinophagaceae bacterium]
MRNVFLLITCFIACTLQAQYAGYKPVADMTAFKTQFAAAAQKTQSIKADFVQEKNLSLLSEKISSKGKFLFKKDNMVRMEYNDPFAYLVVINKNNVYVKDGQKENRISTKSNKLFQQINRMMVDCVQGTALSNTDFKVSVYEGNAGWMIELLPVARNMKDYFKKITLQLSKKDYSVNKLEMYEQSGDNTLISFLNKELNVSIPDALFAVK